MDLKLIFKVINLCINAKRFTLMGANIKKAILANRWLDYIKIKNGLSPIFNLYEINTTNAVNQ